MSELADKRSPCADSAAVQIVMEPLEVDVNNDFPGNYAFTRYGMAVAVVMGDDQPVWVKKVWQRGMWLPIRPFYDRRLRRALAKANRIADAYHFDGYPATD